MVSKIKAMDVHDICELLCEEDSQFAEEGSIWWIPMLGMFFLSEIMPFLGSPSSVNGIIHSVIGLCTRKNKNN